MSLLSTHDLTAFYGDFQALFGVSLHIDPGEVVAIIGANGAGKTTFLRAVVGLTGSPAGTVRFDGRPIGGRPTHDIVALGIALVPEGRRIFASLSVEENLLIGGHRGRPGRWSLARVYELFPALYARRAMNGKALSGGEQQMLAIGRALMANPRLLLLDEVSLGLAPVVVNEIYRLLPAIVGEGTTTLFVEQDVGRALGVCHRLSRRGLALTAIRDSARASESLGIDVFRSKLLVYLVAAFGCGVAGALIYLNLLRILPTAAFSVNWTASMIFVVVIGGIGSIEGPIVGAVVFFALRELLADYGASYLIILGAVAVVVMVWAPQGLWGLVASRFDLRFFPVQRRLRLGREGLDARAAHPAGGGE